MMWTVQQDLRGPRRPGMGPEGPIEADTVEVTEAGALRLLDAAGVVVAAFSPTGWVSCAPYVDRGVVNPNRGGRPDQQYR